MKKKKSGQWARVKYLCLLPLATVAVAAFARPEVSAPLEQLSSAKVTDLAAVVKAKQTEIPADSVKPTQHGEGVFDMVEQMPQFPGGTMEMMNFIGKNLKYPEEAVKQKQDVNLTSGDNPMVICDGKEITPAMMHALDPNAIERVEVFKDEASKAKYGAAGRSGVILVTLKKK